MENEETTTTTTDQAPPAEESAEEAFDPVAKANEVYPELAAKAAETGETQSQTIGLVETEAGPATYTLNVNPDGSRFATWDGLPPVEGEEPEAGN